LFFVGSDGDNKKMVLLKGSEMGEEEEVVREEGREEIDTHVSSSILSAKDEVSYHAPGNKNDDTY
jgi:hypothetical protein